MAASGIPCPLVSLVGYRFWQHDRYANCKVAFTFERVRSIFSPLFSCPSFERGEKKFVKGTQCSGNNPALTFACISKEMFYVIELTFHIRYSVPICYLNYSFHTNVKYIAANKLSVEKKHQE